MEAMEAIVEDGGVGTRPFLSACMCDTTTPLSLRIRPRSVDWQQ